MLIFLLTGNVFAAKNTKESENKKFGDWILACDKNVNSKKDVCLLKQQIIVTKEDKKQEILAFYQIGYFGKDNIIRMMQIFPLSDIYIPIGTMIFTDATPSSKGQYAICASSNCQALAEILPSEIESMVSAKEVKLIIMNSAMQQVAYPLSVKGLKEGLAHLKKLGPIQMEQIDVAPKSNVAK
jgi:invasion protein IalB